MNRKQQTRLNVVICAIMKNESRNILEWIAYHQILGVEKFFLYDNNSTDNVEELLAPLIRSGLVEYIAWPYNPGQLEAYNDFANRYRESSEWACFIDLDEFINIFDGRSIIEWLRNFPDAAAVALQWMNYGPSGHDFPPAEPLISAYRYRLPAEAPVHGHIKCIVRLSQYRCAITPHTFTVEGPICDENGCHIEYEYDYAIQPIIDHSEICINHYYTRSRAEWAEKVERGMADSAIDAPNRRDMSWLEAYERDATVLDERILIRLNVTVSEKQRLQALQARLGLSAGQ